MRTDATSETTTHEPTSAMTRDEEIRYAIADHLPTEPHKALTTPQARAMLRVLGHEGKREISNVAIRGHLLALNREARINRTPDGKWYGIERNKRTAPAQSPEPIRRHRGDVMQPYRSAWTEEETRT